MLCLTFLKISFLHIQSLQVLFRVIHVCHLSFSTEAQNGQKMAPVRAIFELSYIVVFLAATVGVKGETRDVELVTVRIEMSLNLTHT